MGQPIVLFGRLEPVELLARASERLFKDVQMDDAWRKAVKAVAGRGPVIYVLRNVSALDYLALRHMVERLDLPRIGFVNELPKNLRPRHLGTSPSEALRITIGQGQSAALFVKRAPQGNLGLRRCRP